GNMVCNTLLEVLRGNATVRRSVVTGSGRRAGRRPVPSGARGTARETTTYPHPPNQQRTPEL
ncbi:hypothetical protein, partial [Streptomyces neyagawaensis]